MTTDTTDRLSTEQTSELFETGFPGLSDRAIAKIVNLHPNTMRTYRDQGIPRRAASKIISIRTMQLQRNLDEIGFIAGDLGLL